MSFEVASLRKRIEALESIVMKQGEVIEQLGRAVVLLERRAFPVLRGERKDDSCA